MINTHEGKDGTARRYAVAVDGMLAARRYVELHLRQESSKKVSLPAKHFYKVLPTVRAVRLHAEGEDNESSPEVKCVQFGDGHRATLAVSEVYLPSQVARFRGGPGDCIVMEEAGSPLALHEVPEKENLRDGSWRLKVIGHKT